MILYCLCCIILSFISIHRYQLSKFIKNEITMKDYHDQRVLISMVFCMDNLIESKYIYIKKKIVFSVLCISSTYYKRIIIIIEGLLLVMFFGEYIIMMYYQTNEKRRREKNISVCVSLMVKQGWGPFISIKWNIKNTIHNCGCWSDNESEIYIEGND